MLRFACAVPHVVSHVRFSPIFAVMKENRGRNLPRADPVCNETVSDNEPLPVTTGTKVTPTPNSKKGTGAGRRRRSKTGQHREAHEESLGPQRA